MLAASGLLLAFGPAVARCGFRAACSACSAAGALLTPLATVALMRRARSSRRRGAAASPVTLAVRGVSALVEPHGGSHRGACGRRRHGHRRRAHDPELSHEPRRLAGDDADGGHLRERSRRTARGSRSGRASGALAAIAGVEEVAPHASARRFRPSRRRGGARRAARRARLGAGDRRGRRGRRAR